MSKPRYHAVVSPMSTTLPSACSAVMPSATRVAQNLETPLSRNLQRSSLLRTTAPSRNIARPSRRTRPMAFFRYYKQSLSADLKFRETRDYSCIYNLLFLEQLYSNLPALA